MGDTTPTITIRPYQPSDKAAVLEIFEANIREEWSKYHQGKYITNAEGYIRSVIDNVAESDLHNISRVYLEPGGNFWVLVVVDDEDTVIVGMVGLQVLPDMKEGEIRRNCILPSYRGMGWGTKMCHQAQEVARQMGLKRLVCSTPEHGEDVLQFYNKLGFAEFGGERTQEMHGTPVKEVFLEWHVN